MKKLLLSGLLSILFLSVTHAQYDDVYYGESRTGYEGDYFSLEGALDLFKQSYSLRDFERKLNTEENWVNNLDLNYDGRIDYIRVEHRQQGRYHAIIMQALLDRYDVQDVAVIEIENIGRREAILQIIGDEDLYGEEVIVEPVEGYSSNRRGYHSDYGNFVNVYYWDPVQHILDQQYRAYVSPYRWRYYPTWWSPWRQCAWNVYRPRVVVYHRHYHVVPRHRVIHVHNFYRPYRTYSYTVVERTNTVRVKHGKKPIQRPAPVVKQDRTYSDQQRNNRVVEQPRTSTGSRTTKSNPSVSRKQSETSSNPSVTRSTTSRNDHKSRSSVNSSGTSRSTTPENRSSVNRTRSTSSDQKATRSSTSQARQPSRSTTTYNRNNTRSTTSRERSSINSRTAPSTKSRSNSSATQSRTAPTTKARTNSSVSQPSRHKSTGSNTASHSRTSPSKSSSKSNTTRGNSSKGNSSRSKGRQ